MFQVWLEFQIIFWGPSGGAGFGQVFGKINNNLNRSHAVHICKSFMSCGVCDITICCSVIGCMWYKHKHMWLTAVLPESPPDTARGADATYTAKTHATVAPVSVQVNLSDDISDVFEVSVSYLKFHAWYRFIQRVSRPTILFARLVCKRRILKYSVNTCLFSEFFILHTINGSCIIEVRV